MTALATIVVAILILDVGFILGCWWASDARRWDEVAEVDRLVAGLDDIVSSPSLRERADLARALRATNINRRLVVTQGADGAFDATCGDCGGYGGHWSRWLLPQDAGWSIPPDETDDGMGYAMCRCITEERDA